MRLGPHGLDKQRYRSRRMLPHSSGVVRLLHHSRGKRCVRGCAVRDVPYLLQRALGTRHSFIILLCSVCLFVHSIRCRFSGRYSTLPTSFFSRRFSEALPTPCSGLLARLSINPCEMTSDSEWSACDSLPFTRRCSVRTPTLPGGASYKRCTFYSVGLICCETLLNEVIGTKLKYIDRMA